MKLDALKTQYDLWGTTIGVARGGKGPCPPKFLENIVILCFERHFSKQNSVIRLKPNILTLPNFWAGYATGYYDCLTNDS